LVGRKLGKYKITALLGQGGMATVYKGYQEDIDRNVAIKVLPPHPGLDQQFIERFRLEARTIARLQHPHILPLYDYGVEDDILYLVMAYIEGGSLNKRIGREPMELGEIERILRQVAMALDYAHKQGIIHRDIKPDNILLDGEGNALLADFGIVKIAGGESNLTGTGMVGTPAYMAPEQGSGEGITPSADLYSLGIVVYEMLTGKQPFTADTAMQVVIKHMTQPPPSITDEVPQLMPALDRVIQRTLAKQPQDRYQNATEFADAFSRAVHSTESLPDMKMDYRPSPMPASASDSMPIMPTYPTAAPPQNPTIIVRQGTNPLLLLGGFAIIAVLILAVLLLVVNRTPPPPDNRLPDGGTPPPVAINPTALPDQRQNQPPPGKPPPSFGRLSFSTAKSTGDTVTLQVQNLKPLAAGQTYTAWLYNMRAKTYLKLGDLTVDAQGSGVLPPFTDAQARLLPSFFNAVLITRETKKGDKPAGDIAYSGGFPLELMNALEQIFITSPEALTVDAISNAAYGGSSATASPDAFRAGLLVSIRAEARIANQHAGLAQNSTTPGGLHIHAEHTINILMGTKDDYNGDGRGENPGFGIGIPHFVDIIEAQLDKAARAPGSNPRLQSDLEIIRVCLENTRMRARQIVELEKPFLQVTDMQTIAAQTAQATQISQQLLDGADLNGNGQIESFEGECGLEQIKTYGILVGTLNVLEGPLPPAPEGRP
jgi:serine/threonine-protein kinase